MPEFYVCPDHIRTGGYESCCDCGGWEPDDPDRGRLCSEATSEPQTGRLVHRHSVEGMSAVTVRLGEPSAVMRWWRRHFGERHKSSAGGASTREAVGVASSAMSDATPGFLTPPADHDGGVGGPGVRPGQTGEGTPSPVGSPGPAPDATCGLCGRSPAAGWAKIVDTRYCHGDDERPSCYERAQPIYYARLRGETVGVDEFRRRYLDGDEGASQ